MSFKFPWDTGNNGVATRLVEDGDDYHFEFFGENTAHENYRAERKMDGSHGYGETRELREVAWVGNEEALLLKQLTGIDLFSNDAGHTEAFLRLLRGGDFSRLKVIDGQTTTRPFKD